MGPGVWGFGGGAQGRRQGLMGDRRDGIVEEGGGRRIADRIACLDTRGHLFQDLTKLANIGWGDQRGCVSGEHLFQRHPPLLDLERLSIGDTPAAGSAIRLALAETVLV